MVENFYQLFTHTDVLRNREPEYFICEKPIEVDFDNLIGNRNSKNSTKTEKMNILQLMDNDNEQMKETQANERMSISSSGSSIAPVKSFVSILEEGCKKYYDGSPPIFAASFSETPNSFAIRCELYGVYTIGYGRTKKIAKQMAAKNMLKKMIEKESFSDFGLGKTKEEALANLESLAADFQKRGSGDDSVIENWVGKLNERCQKLKLSNATYEIDEAGPPNQRIFIASCEIGKVHVVAHAKTKKLSKTLAAQKMYAELENWKDLADDGENTTPDAAAIGGQEARSSGESAGHEHVSAIGALTDAPLHAESLQKVRAALGDDCNVEGLTEKLVELISSGDKNINKIFLNQELKYIFLEPDFDGNIQCMLAVNGPKDMKNVFYGFGATEAGAKNYAARNALLHLELFVQSSESGRNVNDFSEPQMTSNSLTQAKGLPEDGNENFPSERQ